MPGLSWRWLGYRNAIYLIYGDEADDDLSERVTRMVYELKTHSPIERWLHSKVGLAAADDLRSYLCDRRLPA